MPSEPGPAVYTFRIGHTDRRPVRPDELVSFVTITGEDSPRGFRESELLACLMVGCRTEMVTSSQLVAVEL